MNRTSRYLLVVAMLTAWPLSAAAQEPIGPTLNRALVARALEDRLPLDTEAPFEADGERLYVYLEVNNPTTDEVAYTVTWHHLETDRRFSQTIEAGPSPRWRTWVYHRMSEHRAGTWHVEVVAPNGAVQAELDFTVVPVETPAEMLPGTPGV